MTASVFDTIGSTYSTNSDYLNEIITPGEQFLLDTDRPGTTFYYYPSMNINDISRKLFINLIRSRQYVFTHIPYQISEIKELRKLMEHAQALNDVFGMFDELSQGQKEIFEESVKRRDFF